MIDAKISYELILQKKFTESIIMRYLWSGYIPFVNIRDITVESTQENIYKRPEQYTGLSNKCLACKKIFKRSIVVLISNQNT